MYPDILRITLLIMTLSAGLVSADPMTPVKLVTGAEYMPYSDPLLEEGGLATVLVKAAFRAGGRQTSEVEFKPWARGLLETGAMVFDATFPYARTAEREVRFFYSDELASVEESFFVPASYKASQVEPKTLANKVICRPVGYNLNILGEILKTVSFRIEAPMSLSQCFTMLELGRVDFVFISEQVGWYVIKSSKELDRSRYRAINVTSTNDRTSLHLLVSRQHPEAQVILEQFNKGLALLRESGEYERITHDYLHDDPAALIEPN